MSSTPLVSIVIPVYNGANYVGEAIRSALDQTYPNIEVVVVDDGSTDNGATRRVVESFGDSVRYIVKPNGGVATALNTAIANMRGELFSWLSHDDLYRRKKVARQVEAFQRFGQPCIVIGSFEVMDENGRTMYVHDIGGRNLVARPLDAVFRGLINGCALLVPRTLFDRAGLFEPGLPTTQDYHLWYRMARLVPFVHCPFADVRQRVHPLQGSRQASHLDEASRMFAHIIDSTPVRLMEAYDGSELRFLLRTRQVLSSYPGLKTYLSFRIGELMRRTSFSLVVFSDHGIDPAVVDAWLQTLTTPPAEVVSVVAEGAAAHPRFSVVSCPRFQPHDIVAAAERAAHSESVLFVNAGRLPSAGQLAAAREALVTADADVATPAGAPYALHDLDGLVVRRDALRGLWSMLQEPGFDRGGIGETMQTVSYVVTDPFGAHTNEEIERALRGDTRIDYRRGLSASGIGRILDGMLDERLPVILFVMHPHGGGAHTLLKSLMAALRGKANALVGYADTDGEFRLSAGSEGVNTGVVFSLPLFLPELVQVLRRARVRRVDVHHAIGVESLVTGLLDALRVPFDLTLVDYHTVANDPFLCLEDGRFAGEENLSATGERPLLRRAPLPLLWRASRAIGISRDLAARMERLAPGVRVVPARLWHERGVRVTHVFPPRVRPGEPLRIAVCGKIAPHKGRETLLEAATIAHRRGLPLRYHVLGEITPAPAGPQHAAGSCLRLHGWYSADNFGEALGAAAPHVGWIPSQAPETWSYVLSDLIAAGLPVAATAHGAIPERVHGRPYTWLLPWDATAEQWTDLFLRLHASALQEPPRWTDISRLPPLATDFYFEEYLRPLLAADSGE